MKTLAKALLVFALSAWPLFAAHAQTPHYLFYITVFEGATEAIVWRVTYVDLAACTNAKATSVLRVVNPVVVPFETVTSAKALVTCSDKPDWPLALSIGTLPIGQL